MSVWALGFFDFFFFLFPNLSSLSDVLGHRIPQVMHMYYIKDSFL